MYHGTKIAVLVGDKATIPVYRLNSLMTDLVKFKLEHVEFAGIENPRGVRIVDDEGYALKLAAGLAQEGRIG